MTHQSFSSSSGRGSLTQAKTMIRQYTPYNKGLDGSVQQMPPTLFREEVLAAQAMKILTARFGTRGKSAKGIFLQGFKDELKVKGREHFLNALKPGDPTDYSDGDTGQVKTRPSSTNSKSSGSTKTVIRPAAMVLYSKFCTRLQMLMKNQIFRFGLVPPPVETSWLHDEAQQDSVKSGVDVDSTTVDAPFVITPVEDLLDETEEKMILRLKIHKRALGALILHCEALRPLLREIKRSYDSVLRLRDRQLQETSWTIQNMNTSEKDIYEKTQHLSFEGYEIIKLMDNQCKTLMQHIDKQDAAIRIMTDILNTLESALGEEHELRRDSDDQNKLFIKDINDIRKKLGMAPRPEEGGDTVAVEEVRTDIIKPNEFHYTPDDPLILRKALEICRHDLFMANERLEQLEEEHKDEIPRHLQEQMKLDLQQMKEDHEKLKEKKDDMASQVQGIKSQIEKLTGERADLMKQASELRMKITPRPSWEKVGEFVEGGVPKWKTIYEGKSSIEISNKVIEELNAKKTAAPPEYLTALGDDPEVPRCLRHDTRVRDRRLGRRDAEVLIHDIWKTRIQQLDDISKMREASTKADTDDDFDGDFDEVPPLSDFPDYVAWYFEERFPNVTRRMEWTYNLLDACKRLTMNAKLTQFQGVLMGKIDEGCYHLLTQELSRLQRFLHSRSMELGIELGKMTLGDFRQLIQAVYPSKSDSELQTLMRVVSKQLKAHAEWTMLNYEQLFVETDEGFDSDFIDEFTKQLDHDRHKFIHEIITALLTDLGSVYDYENHEEEAAGEVDVHIKRFYNALLAVDSAIMEATITAALSWVYLKTSILPGMTHRGALLINYVQTARVDNGADAADQAEYDRAVQEIRTGFSHSPDDPDSRNKSKKTGHAKVIKLRVLIRRLKDAAILRDGGKVLAPPDLRHSSARRYLNEYPGEYDEYLMDEDEEEEEEL